MKIYLIRHGKPEALSNDKVDAYGFAQWVRRYNQSNICVDSNPPITLKNNLRNVYSVSSDLARSKHSAQLCLGKPANLISKEFREADIPRLKLPIKLKISMWLIVSRLLWFIGLNGRVENTKMVKKRCEVASNTLERLASQQDVALFGHGMLNKFLIKELKANGWHLIKNSHSYWGVSVLEKR